MDRQQRIDYILDHYERPRHRGRLEAADVVITSHNPACGDVVTVYLQARGDDKPADLSYEGRGCTISQAAASMAMEMLQGLTPAQIDAASVEPMLDKLGSDIVSARQRCAMLAFNAIKQAVWQYQHDALAAALSDEAP